MNDKPTYQKLENQIAELQKQNEIYPLNFPIGREEKKKRGAELKNANISLRQKAEEKYKKKQTLNTGTLSEVNTLKLIHELEVHQIELEMQYEELQLAKEKEKVIADKYTTLYDFAPSGYLTLERNSRICELNFSGAKLIGKERSNLIDNNFNLFITSETLMDFNNFLQKIFADKLKETCEVRFTVNNNPTIFVYIEGIISENGRNCFLTIIDITRRKQVELELIIANKELENQKEEKNKRATELIIANIELISQKEEKEKAEENEARLKEINATKDKLFSIIAHDLRSPFNSILGFSQLLIENLKDYEVAEVETFLGNINISAQNTLVLLDNLLDWAKSQTGQAKFKPEQVVLSSIIQEIFELLRPSAKNKHILLNHIQSEEIVVFADLNMIKTVLRNLISNAIKFTNANGKIDVYTYRKDKFNEIVVSDNGVGMNPETQNKLFRLETSAPTIGTANEKGSGLGLLLCKEFIKKHRGKIWVESELGKGSVFKFTLPLKKMR